MSPDTTSLSPILLFDSGIGGFSICESMLAAGIRWPMVYVADNAWFPYGLREEAALQGRVVQLMDALVKQFQPRLVVLACNTLSTLALPALRARFHVPFVGVVPAIKPAAQMSQSKVIALLATPATVRRGYTADLIRDYAPDCEVLRVGSSELVQEAESLLHGKDLNETVLRSALAPIAEAQITRRLDTVVLGCTHFPLLRAQLADIVPGLSWIDSGEAIARRVLSLAPELGAGREEAYLRVLFTAEDPEREALSAALVRRGLTCRQFSVLTLS